MSPAVKGIYDTLKTLFDHFMSQRAVVEHDFKCAIDVVSKALIIPKYLQDSHNSSKHMLCPM